MRIFLKQIPDYQNIYLIAPCLTTLVRIFSRVSYRNLELAKEKTKYPIFLTGNDVMGTLYTFFLSERSYLTMRVVCLSGTVSVWWSAYDTSIGITTILKLYWQASSVGKTRVQGYIDIIMSFSGLASKLCLRDFFLMIEKFNENKIT